MSDATFTSSSAICSSGGKVYCLYTIIVDLMFGSASAAMAIWSSCYSPRRVTASLASDDSPPIRLLRSILSVPDQYVRAESRAENSTRTALRQCRSKLPTDSRCRHGVDLCYLRCLSTPQDVGVPRLDCAPDSDLSEPHQTQLPTSAVCQRSQRSRSPPWPRKPLLRCPCRSKWW
jgi:hypothetical protein